MKSYRKLSAIILTTLIVLCFASCAKDTSDNTSNIQSANNTALSQKNSGVNGTLSLETETQNSPVSLEQLRQTASEKGAVCAAAFLGSIEENQKPQDAIKDTDKVKKYPFLSEIADTSFVRQPGKQLYCVVPVDDQTKITVSNYIETDAPTVLGVIYEGKAGESVFICGNESDSVSNIHITVTDSNGNKNEWVLSGSGRGPEINAVPGDKVYDFS